MDERYIWEAVVTRHRHSTPPNSIGLVGESITLHCLGHTEEDARLALTHSLQCNDSDYIYVFVSFKKACRQLTPSHTKVFVSMELEVEQ